LISIGRSLGITNSGREKARLFSTAIELNLGINAAPVLGIYNSLGDYYTSSLEIIDLNGTIVMTDANIINGKKINLSNLSTGLYLCRITSNNKSYVHKIIKL
jgi:hypothetical protein